MSVAVVGGARILLSRHRGCCHACRCWCSAGVVSPMVGGARPVSARASALTRGCGVRSAVVWLEYGSSGVMVKLEADGEWRSNMIAQCLIFLPVLVAPFIVLGANWAVVCAVSVAHLALVVHRVFSAALVIDQASGVVSVRGLFRTHSLSISEIQGIRSGPAMSWQGMTQWGSHCCYFVTARGEVCIDVTNTKSYQRSLAKGREIWKFCGSPDGWA